MALFDKLLSLKRKLDDRESRNHGRSCEINPEQVRLLLFNECDWRGRKLLFDSSAIEKVPSGKNDKPTVRQSDEVPSILEVSEGFTYLYKGGTADAKVLGEMIFGAVAMNCKNVSLKIHIMDEPRRLMCTKVFCVPSRRISRERRPEKSSASEMGDKTKPMSVPILKEEEVSLSFSIDRGDSGYYGDQSPYSSVSSTHDYFSMFNIWDRSNMDESCSFQLPSGRKLSACSNGSWHRRTYQNIATRFDLGQSTNLLGVPTSTSNVASSDSQIYSNSSASGTNDSLASTGSTTLIRKNKLGLALLITVPDTTQIDVVKRCLEHSVQLQALITRLRLATLRAGASGGRVSVLYSAAEHAAKWLTDLLYGPKLQSAWLGLITEPRTPNKVAESLLNDLCSVISVGDTKSTNFFISTLLTHVLTYHLGWVSTVSPYDVIDNQKSPQDHFTHSQRPYNALWAQLNDLCGSIGFPPRAAKTIISGPTTQFLDRLLAVLTYFLRCGDVRINDFQFQKVNSVETKVVNVTPSRVSGLKRTATHVNKLELVDRLQVPSVNTQNSDSSVSTLASDVSIKRSSTLANLTQTLSSSEFAATEGETSADPPFSQLKRKPTMMLLKPSSDSSPNSSLSETEPESEQKVVFVLGDNEKLVGLKNKSVDGKAVKKSSRIHNEPLNLNSNNKPPDEEPKQPTQTSRADSPSKCCGQTLQHSKPIKHSGFKFEFDKYPQIVTNYMKSKNLEILDRHYIGKPGNLKLDNFQFDPTVVPPIQEERCEACERCQMMESLLQTPTNASEMEYMNDLPRQLEPQYAKQTVVEDQRADREISPKTFVRRQLDNTLVVNVGHKSESVSIEPRRPKEKKELKKNEKLLDVCQLLEFGMPKLSRCECTKPRSGFDTSLLGGVTDHYVPDLILQGTNAKPNLWELELRRDLDLASYTSKTTDAPVHTVAIVGDINSWQVRIVGRDCGSGGMSSLVGAMLDTLPAMCKARVPAAQCISFIESKLREFCILSKTLADMLMSTDFCDIATLTKSLNIDVNDVPLLLAVATTHTPQVAHRYGLSYG